MASFDNRLCHANVVAGKAAEYLKTLTEEIENAKDNDFVLLAEKFPRGGAIGILEKHPELQPECKLQHSLSAASGATQTGLFCWYVRPTHCS